MPAIFNKLKNNPLKINNLSEDLDVFLMFSSPPFSPK